jgi:hypothetical protein
MRGEAADQADGRKCARPFGERGLWNIWSSGYGSGVLSSSHAFMVASAATEFRRGPRPR